MISPRSTPRVASRWLAVAAAATMLMPAQAAHASDADAAPDYDASPFWGGQPHYEEQDIAVPGDDGGFPNYRIPALTVTNEGTVLASYDGRPTSGDAPGPNSVLQRRSDDGGKTWQEQTTVRAGDEEEPIEGYSDPSYIVDRDTGDIFNFHVFSQDQGFITSQPGVDPEDRDVLHANVSTSSDDGETWDHRTITEDITPVLSVGSRFAASGQGIQLKYGSHAGRLIQQYTIINGDGDFQALSVYSDDHGETWQAGEPVGVGMDENKTVELSDGRVMLNSRDSQNSGYRKVAISEDGGVTYGEVSVDRELPDPTNNASIVRAFPNAEQGSDRAEVLLFSNAGSQSSRSNGTVRASCDDGETWPMSKVFQEGAMSYSTLATLPNGNVGILYEPGLDTIRYAEFNLAWLEGLCAPLSAEELSVERGESDSATVSVENQLGPAIQGVDVQADTPEGWDVSLEGAPARLMPGRSAEFTANVEVPESASGGTYEVPLTMTDAKGRSSQGSITVDVPKPDDEVDGRLDVSEATLVDPQEEPYEVGDRLTFSYDVSNVSDAATTVAPSGNLWDLDPTEDTRNCRWQNLAPGGSYTCDFAYHTVTQEDLDRGEFVPTTTWTSTSGEEVTEIEREGPAVDLP